MYSKGKYALFLLALTIISPLAAFLISLRFYKSSVSQFFMLVFAYYFGSHIALGWDLTDHYLDMREYYFGRSINEILNDPRIYYLGGDYYHVILKIIMSRFKASPAVFAGVVATIYASVFLFFFNQLKDFYNSYLPVLCGMLLLCVVCVVPYNWYNGVRFYTGFFVFAGFYLKYLKSRKWINLLLSLLCMFFHFALILLPLAVILNWVLSKAGPIVRYVLFFISCFYRVLSVDFVPLLLKYFPNLPFLKMSVTNTTIRKNVVKAMAEFRANGNIFYLYRDYLLLFFGLLIGLVLLASRANFRSKYTVLFGMFVTLFTLANFGYADLTFNERTFKMAVLFYYCFLFITVSNNYEMLKPRRVTLIVLTLVPLTYSILTQLVEQREYLFHLDLFLGNFFYDWHGGLTKYHGGFYHKYM